MPYAIIGSGLQSGTIDFGGRQLIPGVEPGGSRGGAAMKDVFMLVDYYVRVGSADPATDQDTAVIFLKMSQEEGLDPGLNLELAHVHSGQLDTTSERSHLTLQKNPLHMGTLWAPRFVGGRIGVSEGGFTGITVNIELIYERVQVPWMEWFIMWDFLDNVPNNTEEY